MNVLFLTLLDFNSLQERNIYTDLLREFVKDDHKVYVISPVERKKKQKTHIIEERNTVILKYRIGNTQKTNLLEKGISTLLIEPQFILGIKKYFRDVKFDLILYSTPPITFGSAINYVKKRDNAKTYLLLKDIFPQNAVDLGILNKKGILYRFFRKKEKRLYKISDKIGCMSQANVDYILQHNREIDATKVEICPNCIEIVDKSINEEMKKAIRKKYDIPLPARVFVYGGNLGKAQGIPFLLECLKTQEKNPTVFFLIIGNGTEYTKLDEYMKKNAPKNVKLLQWVPQVEYDNIIAACDVGMIFLDYRFTIPNFPSRLLGYLQAKLPVLAVTDSNTDLGKIIIDGKFGWWCKSNDITTFSKLISKISDIDLSVVGETGNAYLLEEYSVERGYATIMKKFC